MVKSSFIGITVAAELILQSLVRCCVSDCSVAVFGEQKWSQSTDTNGTIWLSLSFSSFSSPWSRNCVERMLILFFVCGDVSDLQPVDDLLRRSIIFGWLSSQSSACLGVLQLLSLGSPLVEIVAIVGERWSANILRAPDSSLQVASSLWSEHVIDTNGLVAGGRFSWWLWVAFGWSHS